MNFKYESIPNRIAAALSLFHIGSKTPPTSWNLRSFFGGKAKVFSGVKKLTYVNCLLTSIPDWIKSCIKSCCTYIYDHLHSKTCKHQAPIGQRALGETSQCRSCSCGLGSYDQARCVRMYCTGSIEFDRWSTFSIFKSHVSTPYWSHHVNLFLIFFLAQELELLMHRAI